MGKVKQLFFRALVGLSTTQFANSLQTCYKLNGDAAYQDFIPCNEFSGATSYCCGANRPHTNASYTNDICQSNGLCQAIAEVDGVQEWNYFQESCSSTDWPTSSCLRDVCQFPDENESNGNAIMVSFEALKVLKHGGMLMPSLQTPCENTTNSYGAYSATWCCGKNNMDCCGTDLAITLDVTLSAATSMSISSSTGIASSTSASTSASTTDIAATTTPASTSPTASLNSGLSSDASAGIGVGVAVAIMALVGAGVFWYVRHRRAARSQGVQDGSNLMGGRESGSTEQSHTPYEDCQDTRSSQAFSEQIKRD